MPQPEYVRGARFSSHSHQWEYDTGRAYVDYYPYNTHPQGLIYSATIWRRKRRWVKP